MEPQSQKDLLRKHVVAIESLESFKTALEEHIEGCGQQLIELQEDERELVKVFDPQEENDQTSPEHYQLGFVSGETCSFTSKRPVETTLKPQEPVENAYNQGVLKRTSLVSLGRLAFKREKFERLLPTFSTSNRWAEVSAQHGQRR
mmetsp:Transcript_9403/g.13719  ORF Transcript_9403/g.13719 Transcript_9403/m.13719 type:complete len:146 (-) Transcript_9403:700-1137(-)